MANREDLAEFVKEALAAGHSRSKIEAELTGAGWSGGEVREALAAYADTGFLPPVPRPRRIVSARDFLVYALIFGSLLMFAFALGGMIFIAIDLAFGEIDVDMYDTLTKAEAIENANRGMREFLAAVIVAGPVYFWMSFRELRRRRADLSRGLLGDLQQGAALVVRIARRGLRRRVPEQLGHVTHLAGPA